MSDFLQLDVQNKAWQHLEPVTNIAGVKEIRRTSIISRSTTNLDRSGHKATYVNDGRLIRRSNHTMVSQYMGATNMPYGNVRHDFRHYLFGGLVESPYKKPAARIEVTQEAPKFIP